MCQKFMDREMLDKPFMYENKYMYTFMFHMKIPSKWKLTLSICLRPNIEKPKCRISR